MRPLTLLAILAGLSACAGGPGGPGSDVSYRPAPQILPANTANIKRISLRLAVNKTQQFGIEDRLTLRVRDEFLRDGRYPLLPEDHADGIVQMTVTRYLLTPIQYDTNLIPTAYKLRIILDLQFIDRTSNTALWDEKNLEGILTYPAATLPGGQTEEQAREQIYDQLARDVVKRVIEGFGSVTGSSQRYISPDAPSTPPTLQQTSPQKAVNPNPY
jgi:hypothetical protein